MEPSSLSSEFTLVNENKLAAMLKRNLYFINYRMGSAVTCDYFERNYYSPDVFKATFVELAPQCPS